jgi:hypothetical protein
MTENVPQPIYRQIRSVACDPCASKAQGRTSPALLVLRLPALPVLNSGRWSRQPMPETPREFGRSAF